MDLSSLSSVQVTQSQSLTKLSLKVARNVYSCTVVLLSKSLDMVTKNVSPFVKCLEL